MALAASAPPLVSSSLPASQSGALLGGAADFNLGLDFAEPSAALADARAQRDALAACLAALQLARPEERFFLAG
ncbi:hypothetical protein T492DRAFT_880147, partial [Pavlovales sp. CCMP2436]